MKSAVMFAALVPMLSFGGGNIQSVMLKSYLKAELTTRVVSEASKMAEGTDGDTKAEILAAANEYRSAAFGEIKRELMSTSGEEAQTTFVSFVNNFTAAEKEGNADALSAIAESVGFSSVPENFAALRSTAMKALLRREIGDAGNFLGNVQTWLRLKPNGNVPPLHAWLNRDKPTAAVAETPSAAAQPAPKKKQKRKSLRSSEADAGQFIAAKDDSVSSLRSFGGMRKARREKAIKEAEAGMAQVSAERKSADDEYNAKKVAAAQAEAQALQAQAQRLAASEQEAVIQDQNSWRTRVKDVVAAAAGAAGSAFLGNIGGRVGEAAAQAIFKDKRR